MARELATAAPDSWGRPVGALKSALLSGNEGAGQAFAEWALELGSERAEFPIGRYAATLALLILDRSGLAAEQADWLRDRDDFPEAVAEALSAIAVRDAKRYLEAAERVLVSFESRTSFLEETAVADTSLTLAALATRASLPDGLRPSPRLPGALQKKTRGQAP